VNNNRDRKKCFSCGKKILELNPREVIADRDKYVYVCLHCFALIVSGAENGYMRSGKPRLFAKSDWGTNYAK
jgi:hypothetical protein